MTYCSRAGSARSASALYYANLGLRETGLARVWVVSSLVICASVVAFGVTATPFTKLYGRAAPREDGTE